MNNILLKLKRFLGNKNTVTILCVLIGVFVLLFGYNYRVNQAVKPQEIPYALKRMGPKTLIEKEYVGKIKVSTAFIEQATGLITRRERLINEEWYVHYDTVIPEGGLFYESSIIKKEDIPDNAFEKIEDGATVFSLTVNSHDTYGNSIMPGNYIDLYLKTHDEEGKVIFGKFIESIEVLSVRDGAGNDVFTDSQEKRVSGELLFAVKNDLFLLLSEADFLGIEIIPVPRNASYRDEGTKTGTKVNKEELINFIQDKVSELSDEINIEDITKENEENILEKNENNNNNNNNAG